jgi:hypothetical protein
MSPNGATHVSNWRHTNLYAAIFADDSAAKEVARSKMRAENLRFRHVIEINLFIAQS